MQRVLVWLDTTSRTGSIKVSHGAAVPEPTSHRPDHVDSLDSWVKAGWRIHSVGGVIREPVAINPRVCTEEVVTVLEHD